MIRRYTSDIMRRYLFATALAGLVIVLGISPSVSAFSLSSLLGFGQTSTASAQSTTISNPPVNEPVSTLVNDVTQNASTNTCLQYTNHVYEVCTAYIFNSSLA